MYDVAIIGAGVIGASIFRELTKYKLKIVIVDKENDVSTGTTKANSAIIHAGYDPRPGTLMAKYNVRGNELIETICKELSVPFNRNGALVIAYNDEEIITINTLFSQGKESGVKGLKILSKDEIKTLEPNIYTDSIIGGLYAPTSGIIDPFEYTIALIENGIDNGGDIILNYEVSSITKDETFKLTDKNKKVIESKYVINAAGLYTDLIHNMICKEEFKILPRKGEYFVLDKNQGKLIERTIFPCPSKLGKGILVTPTVHGNLLIGPNAIDIIDKEERKTSSDTLMDIRKSANKILNKVDFKEVIRNFSGLRAISDNEDFIINESNDVLGFIDVAGIKSPGLTSAPAIAEEVINIIKSSCTLNTNDAFDPYRSQINFQQLSTEEKNDLIKTDYHYGRIICRCEGITEGEIIDAINRSFGNVTLGGIKRRCRPGMGRCQGGFCGPKVQEIIARELNVDLKDIYLDKDGSFILFGKTKEDV